MIQRKSLWNGMAATLVAGLLATAVTAQERKEIIIREAGADKKETFIIVDKNGQTGGTTDKPESFQIMIPRTNSAIVQGMPMAQSGLAVPQQLSIAIAGEAMPFENKVVKGTPYSADAVTEFTQTLPDGNRIQRKSESQIYRDSEGRTRREFSPMMIGMPGAPDLGKSIQIVDPVAGATMILDPRAHTVTRMPSIAPALSITKVEKGAEKIELKVTTDVESENGVTRIITRRIEGNGGNGTVITEDLKGGDARQFTLITAAEKNIKNENLGKQTIEGVEAEGTRTVETIPAGEVGNEKPLEIVNERWYSNELQLVIMTRHNDPRFGENVYRVTNISRNEPNAALFQVPADYKVNESPTMMRKIEGKIIR